ncbi:hypothetical protein FPOAC2_02941 [Fusarium poae]|jgi:hypothetical protein|uniref:hypothetical protein n=1 Tax=Fusarium poae TaxID=36050 RepID=UPI001CEB2BEB|nr:hypothetical protein FPOAC1_002835 [Fusarium poae]KAG8676826.1 hypothetical protein FPOAC1_002835 [Fusarium poae]
MVQRTFTLIPKFPGRDETTDKPPPRPMTSKQVRNAYKAANKGPKLTRAEQWKQEKAEQERIRKEFEREKAAAKAKVVRDKKKEKELAEKEEKRKKRMPLVNVRPSQETISWFVRGNGSTKKRDAQGKEVDEINTTTNEDNDDTKETTSANDDETEQPVMKIRKLDDILEDDEDISDPENVGLRTREPSPNLSKEQQRIEGPLRETKEDGATEPVEEAPLSAETQMPAPKLPIPEIELEGMEDELDEDFEEDLALGMLEDIEAAMDKPAPETTHAIDAVPRCSIKPNSAVTQPPVNNTKKPASDRYAKDLGLHRPSSPTFIKPPLPQRSPRNLEAGSSSPPRQEPPMSTQAILYNLDDFFPSSSQQARELEEDLDDDNLMPSAPLHLAPIAEEEEDFDFEELEKSPEQLRLPVLNPALESPPPPPRRFFTSSGSHERMCLALQRSRRTAALEQIQQRERSRIQAGNRQVVKTDQSAKKPQVFAKPPPQHIQRNEPRQVPSKTPAPPQQKHHINKPSPPKRTETPKQLHQQPSRTSLAPHNVNTPKRVHPPKQTPPVRRPSQETKENQRPSQEPFAFSASQESYGGDWVDDIALELMI